MPGSTDEEESYSCCNCGDDIDQRMAERLDGYCRPCYNDLDDNNGDDEDDNHDGINSYGYKPATLFHHSDGGVSHRQEITDNFPAPMMGIELEVERRNSSVSLGTVVQRLHSNCNTLVYLKEDCSLTNGFEIVTHPMSIGYVQNKMSGFKDSLDYLRARGYRAWETSTCGLHIHISKNSFRDEKHQVKFIYFIYNNKKALVKFAGRNSQFAKFDLESFVGGNYRKNPNALDGYSITDIVKGIRKADGSYAPSSYERNLALNRNNEYTHELRFFRPSLLFSTVRASIELVHAMWAFSLEVTVGQAIKEKALSEFEFFANWARTNQATYPYLVARMHERRVSKKPEGWVELTENHDI